MVITKYNRDTFKFKTSPKYHRDNLKILDTLPFKCSGNIVQLKADSLEVVSPTGTQTYKTGEVITLPIWGDLSGLMMGVHFTLEDDHIAIYLNHGYNSGKVYAYYTDIQAINVVEVTDSELAYTDILSATPESFKASPPAVVRMTLMEPQLIAKLCCASTLGLMDKDSLTAIFSNPADIGVQSHMWDVGEVEYIMHQGIPVAWGHCTSLARVLAARLGLGLASVWGFLVTDNPKASCNSHLGSGHDFVLYADRYLVDPWMQHYAGISTQSIWDLLDPKDAQAVAELYGDRATWSEMPSQFVASSIQRAFY